MLNLLKELSPAIRLLLLLTVLTGLVYPLTLTGLAQLLFPWAANGSLITHEGRVIGSELIAQSFTRPDYFHPRPSAAGSNGYDAAGSGASNLAPTARALMETITARITALQQENPDARGSVPAELVTASASGLDPHLSPAAARYQIPRIAKARQLPEAELDALVTAATTGGGVRLFSAPRVNVLHLNLRLDQKPKP